MPPVPVLQPVGMQTSSASASAPTTATPTRPLFPGVWTGTDVSSCSTIQTSISSNRVCLEYYSPLAVINVLHPPHGLTRTVLLAPRVANCTTPLKVCSPAGPWTDPSSSEISPQRSPASTGEPKASYAPATDAAAPALGAALFTAGSAMPRSPGQQQGLAHSEATQRRSLLRRLSSKAMQVCHLSHGSAHPGTVALSGVGTERPAVYSKRGPLQSGASSDGVPCPESCNIPLQHASVVILKYKRIVDVPFGPCAVLQPQSSEDQPQQRLLSQGLVGAGQGRGTAPIAGGGPLPDPQGQLHRHSRRLARLPGLQPLPRESVPGAKCQPPEAAERAAAVGHPGPGIWPCQVEARLHGLQQGQQQAGQQGGLRGVQPEVEHGPACPFPLCGVPQNPCSWPGRCCRRLDFQPRPGPFRFSTACANYSLAVVDVMRRFLTLLQEKVAFSLPAS